MKIYGAHLNRLAAMLLTAMMLMTTCFTPALAADIWDGLVLQLTWMDGSGKSHSAQAVPVEDSADRAYWVQVDQSALGQTLTVEAASPDLAYTFYMLDDWGGQTASFTFQPEMDALGTGYEYAHTLFYAVNGAQADMPILLYVSTIALPGEEPEFEPYPVTVRVNYVSESGATLDTQYVECWAGETTPVWASSAHVEGYAIVGSEVAEVYVDQSGYATPGEITFVYREVATPTPVPTDVPTPTPVAEVSVPVVYYHVNGDTLDFQEVFLAPGSHAVQASSAKVSGYQLVSDATVYITVYADGTTDLPSVVFYYEDVAPAEAVIPVYYYHENGTLLDVQEITLTEGTHTITASSDKVSGYELASASSADVTVYADGSASVGYVQFLYKDVYVAPAEAVIPVYYYHENGTLLDVQEITLPEGTHTITASSDKISGYELASASSADVTVYADGSASVGYVQFLYKDVYVAPAEATVTINYYHIDRGLLDTQTVTLTEGVHTVRASSDKVSGYIAVGSTEVEVTVYADGSTHPGAVEFYYEDAYVAPVTADLSIVYQLADGTKVSSASVTLTPGTHTIEPDSARFGSYVLDGEQSHIVYVDENGAISPAEVAFILRQPDVNVSVHYQDDRGRAVAPDQQYTFTEDGSYVIKAAPEGLSSEYELAPGLHSEVTVTVSGGAASQTDVYFYYQLKQVTVTSAVVTVRYFDTYGSEIATAQNITLEPGEHLLTPDASIVPEGYELVSDASITVEVYENGTFSPQEIGFYYRETVQEALTATITVYYRDDRGQDVATAQTLTFTDGTYTIQAAPADLPAGYAIFAGTDDSVQVTVRNGVASQSQVVFYYQKTATEPTVFTLPVNYYDTLGNMIATTQYVKVAAGTYAIQANPADLPDGYELMMESVLTVKVNEDGTTDPEEIAFYYRAPEKKATIIVSYVDESGNAIISPFTMELAAGYHTVTADASRVPSAYDPESAKAVQVYVNANGEANPAQVTFTFARLVVETPIPVGENVYRYATVNDKSVALRSEASTSGGNKTVLRRLNKNEKVYVLKEVRNEKNEVWAEVIIDGQTGYMMSKFIDVMTQAESDAYAAGSTPAPTFTPEPTFTPVPTATAVPTATPTEEPTIPPLVEEITPTPTAEPTDEPTPTPTASPVPYTGYALTTRVTALRSGISSSEMTVIQTLEANELVSVVNQVSDPTTGETWSIVSTLAGQPGFVQDSALRYISDEDAQPYILYWEEINKTAEPTQVVTATPEPVQVAGYAVVLGDDVPFRQMQSEFSRIIDNLSAGTVVYVTGQTAGDGQYWHSVNYDGRWGYIRTDLLRMMTIAEEEAYIQEQLATPTPEPVTTNQPFDQNGLSSYGYVDASSVNWRESASTSAKRIGELKRYAFCLVRGTEYVNGVTWYCVSYGGQTGYVHGDFFKHMTIAELETFLGSEEYLQGITNNSTSGDSGMDDVGYTGTGGIVSAEDQLKHDNPEVWVTTAPWTPIGTVEPIATTIPTLEPLPGQTEQATATPSPTPTFNPLPDVTYPTSDEGQGGSAVVWVVVIGLLLLAVGGAFVMVRHQQNKRRIAMRAAQRRAQAARAQQQQRPYARSAAPSQPRTGTYPDQNRRAASGDGFDSQYTAYSGEKTSSGSYFRSMDDAFTPEDPGDFVPKTEENSAQGTGRVGRRTAYRQAQRAKENDNSFDM